MGKTGEYEFTKEENVVFRTLYKRMAIMAIIIFVGGVAPLPQLAFGGEMAALLLVEGILYIVMSVTFYLPVDNFKRIVTTAGSDITELITAFRELDKGWLIVNIVTAVVVIVRIWLLI